MGHDLKPSLDTRVGVDEYLGTKRAVKTKRNVVLKPYPCQRPPIDMPSIENGKLSLVCLRNIELDQNITIVLVPFTPAGIAVARDKDRLSYAAVRVPHLTRALFGIVLEGGREGGGRGGRKGREREGGEREGGRERERERGREGEREGRGKEGGRKGGVIICLQK